MPLSKALAAREQLYLDSYRSILAASELSAVAKARRKRCALCLLLRRFIGERDYCWGCLTVRELAGAIRYLRREAARSDLD